MKTMKVELTDELAKPVKNIAELIGKEPEALLGRIVCNEFAASECSAGDELYGLIFDDDLDEIERGENSAFEIEAILRGMREKMSAGEIVELITTVVEDNGVRGIEAQEKLDAFALEGEKQMMRS